MSGALSTHGQLSFDGGDQLGALALGTRVNYCHRVLSSKLNSGRNLEGSTTPGIPTLVYGSDTRNKAIKGCFAFFYSSPFRHAVLCTSAPGRLAKSCHSAFFQDVMQSGFVVVRSFECLYDSPSYWLLRCPYRLTRKTGAFKNLLTI